MKDSSIFFLLITFMEEVGNVLNIVNNNRWSKDTEMHQNMCNETLPFRSYWKKNYIVRISKTSEHKTVLRHLLFITLYKQVGFYTYFLSDFI